MTAPGKIQSSDKEEIHQPRKLASKVVKVDHPSQRSTSHKGDKFSHLRNDPDFASFLDEMLDNQMSVREWNSGASSSRHHNDSDHCDHWTNRKQQSKQSKEQSLNEVDNNNVQQVQIIQNKVIEQMDGGCPRLTHTFKSLSDTTIYSPGLRKTSCNTENDALIDKISNFVESIKISIFTHWRHKKGSR